MIVAFCGHRDYVEHSADKAKILSFLETKIANEPVDFFLGAQGGFDRFAYTCASAYRESHPHARIVYVTPYITLEYQKSHLNEMKDRFDEILYPGLEGVPLRFAISKRNKWIAQKADLLIAYVCHTHGGAYQTLSHAKRQNKEIFNLFSCHI